MAEMKKPLLKRKDILFFIITFIFCAVLFYGMRMGLGKGVNADEVSNFFVGKDAFDGNFFLKGWHFSTGLFLLPAYEAALFTNLFGYRDVALFCISSINYALLVSLPLLAIYKAADRYKIKNSLCYVIIAWLIVFIPRDDMLYNSCTHVLSVAVSMAFFFTYYKLSSIPLKKASYIIYGITSIVMGFLAVTNTMFLYTAVIPIFCTGVCVSVQYRNWKSGLRYCVPSVLSAIAQEIMKKIWVYFRLTDSFGNMGTVFTSKDNLWDGLMEGVYNVLQLFGINTWSKSVMSVGTVKAFIGLCILIKLIVELVKFFRNPKSKYAVWIYMFIMLAFINFIAYTVSSLSLTFRSTHLIFPILFGVTTGGILAWVENIHNGVSGGAWKGYAAFTIALFILMLPKISYQQPEAYMKPVSLYLVENGYTKGYGGFWSATTAMYYAGFYGEEGMNVVPLISSENDRLAVYRWMTKGDNVEYQGNFFICNKRDLKQYRITDEKIRNTFGMWKKKLKFDGGIFLYLWDEPISTNGFLGSGNYNEQMALTDVNMRQPDGSIVVQFFDILFGPFLNLDAGVYNLIVEAETDTLQHIFITADKGQKILEEYKLAAGINHYTFQLEKFTENIEFVVRGAEGIELEPVTIRNIWFGKADSMNHISNLAVASEEDVIYGPYYNLEAGIYQLDVDISKKNSTITELYITTDTGSVLKTFTLKEGMNKVWFSLSAAVENVKFAIRGLGGDVSSVHSLTLKNTYEVDLSDHLELNTKNVSSPIVTLGDGIYRVVANFGNIPENVVMDIIDSEENLIASGPVKKGINSVFFEMKLTGSIQVQIDGIENVTYLQGIVIEKIMYDDYLEEMQVSSEYMRADGSIVLGNGDMIFGPNLNVKKGYHLLRINVDETNANAQITIGNDVKGAPIYIVGSEDTATHNLSLGENIFDVYFGADVNDVEFIVRNDMDEPIRITGIFFE